MIDRDIERRLARLKQASRQLMSIPSERKNTILELVADQIINQSAGLLAANRNDLARIAENPNAKITPAFRDRLTLNESRIAQMAESLRAVAKLPDPVGEIVEQKTLPNGLKVRRVRSPLGTILMIFESRPNVITEVFALAFKSGNSIALRGGSDSKDTAAFLYQLIDQVLQKELAASAVHPGAIPFVGVEDYDRALVGRLLQRNDIFDICIPRGGDDLIARVSQESRMPVIKNDKGVCHLYVHENADLTMATNIAVNAKNQRPGVCNSIETILIDRTIARQALSQIVPALHQKNVSFFVCGDSHQILQDIARTDGIESPWVSAITLADESIFFREYLDLKINLKVVEGYELATFHIDKFGSHHSETIVTNDESIARRFQNEVDSACVYWNASTRFTDGFELGLGGEIGISTQKLHVRGPVGLRELTSVRWVIDGAGHVRS